MRNPYLHIVEWQPRTRYAKGAVVQIKGHVYHARHAHVSSDDFRMDSLERAAWIWRSMIGDMP